MSLAGQIVVSHPPAFDSWLIIFKGETMVETILETAEKTYRLPEKDRLAILKSKPGPSIYDVIESKREAFREINGDDFGQQSVNIARVQQ